MSNLVALFCAYKVHWKWVSFNLLCVHFHPIRISDCPGGLAYAEEGTPCLEFTYALTPLLDGPLSKTAGLGDEFVARFEQAVDVDGELYDAMVELYPETSLLGLGSPGKGVPLADDRSNEVVLLTSEGGDDDGSQQQPVQVSGLPLGGVIGIVVAAALLALIVAGFIVKRHRRDRSRKLDDSNLSEDVEANEVNDDAANVEEWLDEEDESNRGGGAGLTRAGSSLAAMGVASTVATRLSTGDTEVMMLERQAWSKKEPVV